MTAEIAIMNKGAVALAADSALTLGPSGKIFNTVNKLFTLSKHEPIGIMVFGGGALLDVPWENLVKMYRGHLKGRHFDKLEQYVTDFLNYLGDPVLFPPEKQLEFVARMVASVIKRLRETFELECERRLQKGKLSGAQTDAILERLAIGYYEKIQEAPEFPQAPAGYFEKVTEKYSATLGSVVDSIFPRLQPKTREKLIEVGIALLTRARMRDNAATGVVIAGFGRKDLFPALCQITVHGVVCDWVRAMVHPVNEVTHDQSGIISAFAQQEVVSAFMSGIDPGVQRLLNTQIAKRWDSLEERIGRIKNLADETRIQILETISEEKQKDIFAEVGTEQHRTVIDPILNAVAALPKDELAAMAESLVNLTVFRRKFSLDAETVGGPIDVAVISKWDGFIWIKRKHYFNKELNPHFVARYFCDE